MKTSKKPLVVIDTNVLLVSISSRSKYHWLFLALLQGKFSIAFSQEILLEYEEIIGKHWDANVASNLIRSLGEIPNAILVPIYYQLELIVFDTDDNKFVDCAFAANAD